MQTIHWPLLDTYPASYKKAIKSASNLIKQGQLIAFPTETVYGLGANAFNEESVLNLFKVKQRPNDNPLIVHVASIKQIESFTKPLPPLALQLANKFWPGPLTLICQQNSNDIPQVVTADLKTIAVRIPHHRVAYDLLETSQVPVVAPSANLSGRPSPTRAEHVLEDFNTKIAGVLDYGSTTFGLESTIIDCTTEPFTLLRLGSVTLEEIKGVIGNVAISSSTTNTTTPKAPGMKYRHYAPRAPFILVNGSNKFMQSQINSAQLEGKKVGVYTTNNNMHYLQADHVVTGGSRDDFKKIAENMYHVLRSFDHTNVDIIFGEVFPNVDLGRTIMNRLIKASNNRIIIEKNSSKH